VNKDILKQLIVISVTLIPFLFGNIFLKSFEVIQGAQASQVAEEKEGKKTQKEDEKDQPDLVLHNEIVVTATRTEKTVFDSPKPVSVVNLQRLEELAPNNISELLPEIPGADIVGVGPSQSRPIIRGLRGQRILLLSDGIRMSNSRRTQDFGEIPALVDVSGMERIEIVRGPASVLYGSEAIGGVVNMITQTPLYHGGGTNIFGNLGYRFSSAGSQHKGFANINGNVGNFGFMMHGTYRNAYEYRAPSGSFGEITLDDDTPVNDTGVQDNSMTAILGFRIADNHDISMKYEYYQAKDAGFGYVDPAVYSPEDPTIQLMYPDQKMQKFTLKYENRSLHFVLADGLSLTGYFLDNTRTFDTNIAITFFPGAGVNIRSSNYTDVTTFGSRFEFTKVLFNKHILTYGMDFFQDDSQNTDISTTEIYGIGPPMESVDTIPNVPNAFLRSFGIFLQDEISLFSRSSLVLGMRYQSVYAHTNETPGLDDPLVDSTDSALVGAANFLYGVTDNFKLVFSLGRGFRSPNLPERFFQGVTPDGSGFQVGNPDLKPEKSFNIDAGFRYKLGNLYVESTYFHNDINDGIQIAPTGETNGRLPEFQNVNIEKLRLQGVEILGQFHFDFGLKLMANYSYFNSKNLTNPSLPYSDTYSSRINFNVRYTFPKNLFWIEYHIRHNGDQKNVNLVENPIGSIIPSFTVHTFRMGVMLFKNSRFPQHLGLIIDNLTNTLYSEFSNASFFRPGARRHLVLTWSAKF
jgi:hemoglobin/transferrin/lactoferrin receptor protein